MPNTLDKSYLEKCLEIRHFQGKVAFITGGAGTICRVQAEALVLLELMLPSLVETLKRQKMLPKKLPH